jgi:hypothetical protein
VGEVSEIRDRLLRELVDAGWLRSATRIETRRPEGHCCSSCGICPDCGEEDLRCVCEDNALIEVLYAIFDKLEAAASGYAT